MSALIIIAIITAFILCSLWLSGDISDIEFRNKEFNNEIDKNKDDD